eukprot:UN11318
MFDFYEKQKIENEDIDVIELQRKETNGKFSVKEIPLLDKQQPKRSLTNSLVEEESRKTTIAQNSNFLLLLGRNSIRR